MLILVAPFCSVSQYYDLLHFNYRQGNEAKTQALKLKLLIQHKWHSGQRGGQIVLLEPTRAAAEMFGLPTQYENPGFMHRYLQHKVKEAMTAQGYKVSVEKSIKGNGLLKSIDVLLERDKELTAVECAVSDAHEVENIRKDLRVGVDKVFIVCLDKKVMASVIKKIQAAFSKDVLSRVTVCTLAEFIDKHS